MQKIMKHQKNKYSKNKNLLRLFTLFAFIFPVWGTSPEIQFSASTQYPRISFLDEDPSLQWRTNLSYRQSLGRFASISSLFEYGPKIHQHLNPFRLYSFISEVKTDHFRFQLGRIPYWSPALLTRIDGLSFRYTHKTLGTVDLLGGFRSVIDFSDTTYVSETFLSEDIYLEKLQGVLSWSKGSWKKNISLFSWVNSEKDSLHIFSGLNGYTSIFAMNLHGTFVWDQNNSRPHYLRLRLSKNIKFGRLFIGYREKRYSGFENWTWATQSLSLPATATVGLQSNFSSNYTLLNQLSIRFSNASNLYFHTTINSQRFSGTLLYGNYGEASQFGGSIGTKFSLNSKVDLGGSISLNLLSDGDIVEPFKSSALFTWINWSLTKSIKLRFFSQFYSNPSFKIDYREGVSINAIF
jgi:hypothetical protein